MNIPKLRFVFLPAAILKSPPIRHRGDGPDAGLTVYEFVIAATCAGLARTPNPIELLLEHAFPAS